MEHASACESPIAVLQYCTENTKTPASFRPPRWKAFVTLRVRRETIALVLDAHDPVNALATEVQ